MLMNGDSGVKRMNKLKIIELFSGIGAQVAALKRLGVDYEVVGISEIDKYAIQSYEAINGPTFNYGDITKIPMLDYADLWTYSFPCQDLSVAGNQKGISEGTRSGLLLHVERLLELSVLLGNQPKYLLLENVKNLVGKKFKADFDRWLAKLDELGYNNYWQVLNAKDYDIPQNRERVFVVSIRKDVDTKGYKFPEKVPLTRRLKDVLESQVDERYYLPQEKVDKLTNSLFNQERTRIQDANSVWETVLARDWKDPKCVKEPLPCASRGRNPDNPSDRTPGVPTEQRLEIKTDGCSNTLTTVEKDNYVLQPMLLGNVYGLKSHGGFGGDVFDENGISRTIMADGGNRTPYVQQVGNIVDTGNWDNPQRGRIYSPNGCSPALNTCQGGGLEPKILCHEIPQTVTVRKHTVDVNGLKNVLRSHKTLSNKDIALILNVPQTKVEHWFRNDECFSIPDAETWQELKALLNIQTDEFDKSIMEFEEKENVFEKANRCYDDNGIAPTLTSTSADEKIIESKIIIGSTQKNAYIGSVENYSPCLTEAMGMGGGQIPMLANNYRIRKLTPLECWRLMDFTDDEFYAAQLSGVSNSQLYKQAGNSICVGVLVGIFRELLV